MMFKASNTGVDETGVDETGVAETGVVLDGLGNALISLIIP